MQSVKLSHIRKWRQQPIRVRNPLGRIQLRPDGQRSRSLGLNPCQELLYVKVKFVFTLRHFADGADAVLVEQQPENNDTIARIAACLVR